MTNNSLAENLYDLGELMADNLNSVGVSDADVDDGLTTLANKILEASPAEKVNTILTLDTPLVVYTDNFNVTGTLTDSEENPISGATVQLIWNDGTEHIATGTTDNDGVFSFTSTDPASVSSYSFQLFFAGDNDYNASNSSVVNVNTAKETSVLVITSPASGAVVSTDSVTVTGTVKDNDGTPLTGEKVYFLLNNSSHAGYTTIGSNGSFTKTVTRLSAGSNSITVSFAGITTHTAANQSIIVNRATFDGLADLELIDGSQILSYADEQSTPNSQYATLETQLMNGESAAAIEGVSVGFYDYSDENNPVLLGSDDTDSSGKASFTYHSTGVGDIPVKAKVGSLLTKTFVIEDCVKTYMNTYLSGTESMTQSFDYSLPSHFRVEYEYSETTASACSSLLWIGESTSKALIFGRTGGNDANYKAIVRTNSQGTGDIVQTGSSISNTNTYKSFFAEYNGTVFNFNDDITVSNLNGVNPSKLIQVSGYHATSTGNGKGMIRNIKIKPL